MAIKSINKVDKMPKHKPEMGRPAVYGEVYQTLDTLLKGEVLKVDFEDNSDIASFIASVRARSKRKHHEVSIHKYQLSVYIKRIS